MFGEIRLLFHGVSGRFASTRKKYFACGLGSVSVAMVLPKNPLNQPFSDGVHVVRFGELTTRYTRVGLLVNVSVSTVRAGLMLLARIRR